MPTHPPTTSRIPNVSKMIHLDSAADSLSNAPLQDLGNARHPHSSLWISSTVLAMAHLGLINAANPPGRGKRKGKEEGGQKKKKEKQKEREFEKYKKCIKKSYASTNWDSRDAILKTYSRGGIYREAARGAAQLQRGDKTCLLVGINKKLSAMSQTGHGLIVFPRRRAKMPKSHGGDRRCSGPQEMHAIERTLVTTIVHVTLWNLM